MDYNCANTYDYNMQYPMYNMFPNPNFFASNVLEPSNNDTRNRFVYVNQNFVLGGTAANTKVLINPNFKATVHINPNFRKPAKPSIHVNPNIIKINDAKPTPKANAVIKPMSEDCSNTKSMERKSESIAIIATRTKLVRVATTQRSPNLEKQDRRKSVHTKYKIVHCNDKLMDENKSCQNYLKCRYKIDKNISNTKKPVKKKNINSKYKVQNISLNKTVSTKSMKMGNSRYISINGTLYKKTPNVLKKADLVKMTSGKANINKNKILLIKGHLYKLDHRQRKLKMVSVANNSSQKLKVKHSAEGSRHLTVNKFVKLNKTKQKIKLSNIRSTTNNNMVNQMRKCNLPCPIYRRFGKCKAHEMGKCIKVHNPNQIMLCTKFLQGACLNSRCLLSHKVSAEKMPTCKYFLEGLCSKEDCVYLHVKISAKADICKDFLEGYCKKAKECAKRHQFLCPDYEKNGKCPRKRCQYPHGNVVRNTKYINKVAKRIIKRKTTEKSINVGTRNTENEVVYHDKNIRYYADDAKDLEIESKSVSTDKNRQLDSQLSSKQSQLSKRARLGALPSYIPFGESKLPISDVIT